MNARYWGKKIIKNELGYVTDRFKPCVTVTYKEHESALAQKVIDYIEKETGISGDSFGREGLTEAVIEVDFSVDNREEGEDVLAAYRDAKEIYKCK